MQVRLRDNTIVSVYETTEWVDSVPLSGYYLFRNTVQTHDRWLRARVKDGFWFYIDLKQSNLVSFSAFNTQRCWIGRLQLRGVGVLSHFAANVEYLTLWEIR